MNNDKEPDVDPDYESYNSALEQNEKEDKKVNMVKLKKIIEEEYDKQIMERQEQVEHIEHQIFKVRKLLHLLRYVLIMSYYKRKELEYNPTEEEATTSAGFTEIDKQNRIHPALKKLLGDSIHNLDHIQIKDKRKVVSRTPFSSTSDKKSDSKTPPIKKIKLMNDNTPKAIEPVMHSARNRKKSKYRLIIGNTSQYITSAAVENLTHKWMVYVRGPKEMPNISHIVEKVIFYLHPSYKPYDEVEICESPYHLSRRGWGEFPIRVQIFFKVTLNKPIDVIHNIVLDKTYTGKQTLGKETIVDVFLYDDQNSCAILDETVIKDDESSDVKCMPQLKTERDIEELIENIKMESEIDIESEIKSEYENLVDNLKVEPMEIETFSSSLPEHDYCFGNQQIDQVLCEHSYSLPSENMPKPPKEEIIQDESNELIHGLGKTYLEQTGKLAHQLYLKNGSTNKSILVKDKIDREVQQAALADYSMQLQHKILKNKFKNMGEALFYAFKHLPLCSHLAKIVHYKRMYPFTASSLKEFVSWNVGKRRSAEWSRAMEIRKVLQSFEVYGVENWSIKSIIMFGRSHEFTPFVPYGLFPRNSQEKELILSCYANSDPNIEKFQPTMIEENITVNVDSLIDNSSATKKKKPIDISNPQLNMECSFIREAAMDCGIILREEEIEPGVVFNGAERMILEAVKCFAENLIRRARNHKICSYPNNESGTIKIKHVQKVLNERPEMLALERFKQQRRTMDFFS